MLPPNTRKPAAPLKSADIAANLEEGVRRLAYDFYEQGGRKDGRNLEDWFRAKEEIKPKKRSSRTNAAVQPRKATLKVKPSFLVRP
jgi:Protein of unknown function (DUF2934)